MMIPTILTLLILTADDDMPKLQFDPIVLGEGQLDRQPLDVRTIQKGEPAPEEGCFLPTQACITKAQQQVQCETARNQFREQSERCIRETGIRKANPLIWLGIGIAGGLVTGWLIANKSP